MAKKIKHFRHSYQELDKVARKYYGDRGFCSVIATAVACDLSFGTALKFSKQAGRKHRQGSNWLMIEEMCRLGGKRLVRCHDFGKTLTTSERNAPKLGRFIFLVSGHVAAMRDGVLEDWSAEGSKRRIIATFEVEDI